MKYDSIIFDLDGTLWNSTKEVRHSWNLVLETLPDIKSLPTEDEVNSVMGLTSKDLMEKLFPYISYERGQEIFEMCCKKENEYLLLHGAKLYPGLEDTVKKLSDALPLFIVSNCGKGYIETFLEAHKMAQYFKDFECIGNTGLSKAENIGLIINRNNLASPVYVGDTSWDYDSATKAGIPFIFAEYGFGNVEGTPSIKETSELIDMILTK